MITIHKTEYGYYQWQPDQGRRYSISLEQIFPDKHRIAVAKLRDGQSLMFNWWEYDNKNKILMVEYLVKI